MPILILLNMEETDNCPICFGEYTTSTSHMPTSLKCGHIFGNSCIIRWFNGARTAYCPSCSKRSKQSELRIIFATSIRTLDSTKEKEILEKYLNEKEKNTKLINENTHLRTSINYLQQEIKRLENIGYDINNNNNEIFHAEVPKLKPTKFLKIRTNYSLILFDKNNLNIIITTRHPTSIGYIKSQYDYRSYNYVAIFSKEPEALFITDAKISPFNDSLILLCYNKTVKLINSNSDNELINVTTSNKIRVVSFATQRNFIYFADDKGYFYVYDLNLLCIIHKEIIGCAIHSLYFIDNYVYVGSIDNIIKIKITEDSIERERLDILNNEFCIYLTGDNNNLFITTRNKEMVTKYIIYKIHNSCSESVKSISKNDDHVRKNDFKIFKAGTQYKKHRDKIYDKILYVINEQSNTLELFRPETMKLLHKYNFKEKILGFDVATEKILVLTSLGVQIMEKII